MKKMISRNKTKPVVDGQNDESIDEQTNELTKALFFAHFSRYELKFENRHGRIINIWLLLQYPDSIEKIINEISSLGERATDWDPRLVS